MRFLLTALLTAVAASAQSAKIGTQEVERGRQLLQSAQWREKAWGAYMAGGLHSDDLRQPLIDEFRAAAPLAASAYDTEEHAFIDALFDAAIEANLAMPATLFEPFEAAWSAPVLILLAHADDREDALLRLSAESSRDVVWLAANNLLLEMNSQRWYGRLLGSVTITHRFTVIDGPPGPGSGGGIGGASCGDGILRMPEDFPPINVYGLQDTAQKGSVLLSQGPQDVYYTRTLVPTNQQVGFGSCGSSLNRAAIRTGYLARLASMSTEDTENLLHSQTQILYASPEQYSRHVEQSLKAQGDGIRGMLSKVSQRGLEYPSETLLRIAIEVSDQRRSTTDALPSIAPREIDLR